MNRLEKTRAFLTEFIIVILFFSVSVIIVLQTFVSANQKSVESINITKASLKAEAILEEAKANINNAGVTELADYMTKELGYTYDASGNMYYQYFDKEFEAASSDDAYIIGVVKVNKSELKNGNMYTINVSFSNNEKSFADITTKIFDGGSHEK